MKYDAIVLGGGQGKRLGLGFNKVLYKLNDKTIIEKAMEAFEKDEDCLKIVCVLNKEDRDELTFKHDKLVFVSGGKERIDSVFAALLKVDAPYVFIHDGARPDICLEDLMGLKEALKENAAACLGKMAKDTIKVVQNGHIIKTLDRNTIFLAQTPQVFRSDLIKEAYQKAQEEGLFFTDDTAVFARYFKQAIKAVEAQGKNDKITFKEDLFR